MQKERVRAHILISGRVQGVFFRGATEEEANNRNLTGWVRNLPSGKVEAVFEGDKKAIEEVIQWCHQGPPTAHVTSVEVQWEPYHGDFADFRVI